MIEPQEYHSLEWWERRDLRNRYVAAQGGRCMWCDEPLNKDPADGVMAAQIDWSLFPPNFQKWPVHLQHCHVTGMTEGAVHMRCNAYLWQYEGR